MSEQMAIFDFMEDRPKVNSFFCGAGGFDLGFIQAGFEIVGAWDFDKYAVQSYNHNIGGAEQADVSKLKGDHLPKANGWLFGFPCQDISVAGKQAGMIKGQTRSGLFYEIMRLLGEVSDKPEWILAENVKAVSKFIPTIEEEYDKAGYRLVSPQLYNSKYWGVPQNRERYFLLGIRKDLDKQFVFPEQQTDFIPKLSSILEENVDEKYYIDDLKAAKIIEQAMNRVIKENEINMLGLLDMKGNETVRRVYDPEGLAPTLTTSEGGHRQPKILEEIQSVFTDKDGAAYCCDANYAKGISPGDVGNGRRTQIVTVSYNRKDGIEKEIDVAGALTSSDWRGLNQNQSKAAVVEIPRFRVRKLTPREYARLQGFSDSYEQIVSNSQFYKQMGNAVTVNVAHAIATAIKEQL
jgi:DNA (cytosine-5)-methyltransferase 1